MAHSFHLSLLALCLSACLSACASEPAHKAFVPDEASCKILLPAQALWLGAVWKNYAKYIRVCHIAAADGRTSLMLISVWADLYYADTTVPAGDSNFPKPLLVDRRGAHLGELPANFPADPPAELNLYFSDWRNGLPNRIDLCLVSPAASGTQRLPALRFRPGTNRYEPASDSGLSTRECNGS